MIVALSLLACGSGDPEPAPAQPAARQQARTAHVVKPAQRDEAFAAARCNDGSDFAYTLRPGSSTWVVNLAGGFFCDDEQVSCSDRSRRLTTTVREDDGAVRRMKSTGVFSTDPTVNPDFADATHVDAHYCSSDLWLGDSVERRPSSGDPERGWYFSGRENVRVLLASLQQHAGLDDDDPDTRVLFVGTSAGGAGLAGNLDAVIAALPRTAADGRLKVVLDGSWVPEVAWEPGKFADADRWGPAHPTCAHDLSGTAEDPVLCLLGPRWWPYAEATDVPILVQLSGLDKTQTPVFGVDTPEAETAWQARVRASLEPLPWVFSGGHAYHIVAVDSLFDRGPEGRTFRDLLGRFWRGEAPEQIFFRYP